MKIFNNLAFILIFASLLFMSCGITNRNLAPRNVKLHSYLKSGVNLTNEIYEREDISEAEILGLQSIVDDIVLKNKGLAQIDRHEASVIIVHGVQTKRVTEFDLMVKLLSYYLDLKQLDKFMFDSYTTQEERNLLSSNDTPTLKEWLIGNEDPIVKVSYAQTKPDEDGLTTRVKFIFVHWSPATIAYKNEIQLSDCDCYGKHTKKQAFDCMVLADLMNRKDDFPCAQDSDPSVIKKSIRYRKRFHAKVNSGLETTILADGLGDVAAALDPKLRAKIFIAFEQATILQTLKYADFRGLYRGNVDDDAISEVDLARQKAYFEFINRGLTSYGSFWEAIDKTSSKGSNAVAWMKNSRKVTLNSPQSPAGATAIITGSFGSALADRFIKGYLSFLRENEALLQHCVAPIYDKRSIYLRAVDPINIHRSLKLEVPSETYVSELADALWSTKYQWYLLSNQLSLLRGASLGFSGLTDNHGSLLKNVASSRQVDNEKMTEVVQQTVSFYDPNDLLGFRIPASEEFMYGRRLFNITLPVQATKVIGLANPGVAHSLSKYNPYVLQILTQGIDSRKISKELHTVDTPMKIITKNHKFHAMKGYRCSANSLRFKLFESPGSSRIIKFNYQEKQTKSKILRFDPFIIGKKNGSIYREVGTSSYTVKKGNSTRPMTPFATYF